MRAEITGRDRIASAGVLMILLARPTVRENNRPLTRATTREVDRSTGDSGSLLLRRADVRSVPHHGRGSLLIGEYV